MSIWFFGVFKVFNITGEAFCVVMCQFPEGENANDIINADDWRTVDIIMFGKLVSIYKSYLIYGSAWLPQDGNPGEPSVSVLLLTYTIIFVYYNMVRHLYTFLRALTYSQLYVIDVVEYFGDRIPTHQLRLYIQAELTIAVDNTIDLKEY